MFLLLLNEISQKKYPAKNYRGAIFYLRVKLLDIMIYDSVRARRRREIFIQNV